MAQKADVDSATVFYTFGSSGIWNAATGTVVDPSRKLHLECPLSGKEQDCKAESRSEGRFGSDRRQRRQQSFSTPITPFHFPGLEMIQPLFLCSLSSPLAREKLYSISTRLFKS